MASVNTNRSNAHVHLRLCLGRNIKVFYMTVIRGPKNTLPSEPPVWGAWWASEEVFCRLQVIFSDLRSRRGVWGLRVELSVIRVSKLSLMTAVAFLMKTNVLLDLRHHVVYVVWYKSQMKMTNGVSNLTVIYITWTNDYHGLYMFRDELKNNNNYLSMNNPFFIL